MISELVCYRVCSTTLDLIYGSFDINPLIFAIEWRDIKQLFSGKVKVPLFSFVQSNYNNELPILFFLTVQGIPSETLLSWLI